MPATDTPNVRFPPPTLYLAGFLIGYLLHRTVGGDDVAPERRDAVWTAGVVVIAAGVALIAWAVTWFRRRRTTLIPMRASAAMVDEGPYRFTRNPMYVGLSAIYTGATLMAGYLWPLAALPLVLVGVRWLIVEREERYLERRFGDDYRAYKARVRRWL
jgi:protein-S-isoprenylcysteine O-methyltransferase Ste14